jgi:pimeloyl-ACP methyl ester carboxylesterase
VAEDCGAHRSRGEADEDGRERQQYADKWINGWKKFLWKDSRGSDAVEQEVVPLEDRADRGGAYGLDNLPSLLLASIGTDGPSTTVFDEDNFSEIVTDDMPTGFINGVHLYYEEAGDGVPMIFVHEFAGEARSWAPQVRFFRRCYRTITFNARGYPPSDVPEDPAAYSQRQAVEDIRGVLDYLQIDKAHVIGLSMGGYAALHFGLLYPERALSLVVAGAGYGSKAEERETFRRDCTALAERFEREPMETVAAMYAMGPARVQFRDKDPQGWEQFCELLKQQSAKGHALTMRGVQIMRESIYDLGRSSWFDLPCRR